MIRPMKPFRNVFAAFIIAGLALGLLSIWQSHTAQADQSYYVQPEMVKAQVACNGEVDNTHNVSVSGTSAASTATGKGSVWVTCTVDACMAQGALGATGTITATVSGGFCSGTSIFIPQYTPWQWYSRGSSFAFIGATASTGFCQIAECM